MKRPSMSMVRTVFATTAVAAIIVAFMRTLDEAEGVSFPPSGGIIIAGGLAVVGLCAALGAWHALLPQMRLRDLAPGFFLAQLAKYVPGSVWQGVGQVLDAVRLGSGRGEAAVAYLTQMATQVAAGGLLVMLVLVERPSGWLLLAGALSPLSAVFLHRRLMHFALSGAARLVPSRLGHLPDTVARQAAILRAAVLGVVTMAAISAGYTLMLPGVLDARSTLVAIGAFSLAWVLGFLVIPVPSGLGVRELVLVAALGGQHGVAAVLAAAVVLRLVLIVVEAILAGVSHLLTASTRTS